MPTAKQTLSYTYDRAVFALQTVTRHERHDQKRCSVVYLVGHDMGPDATIHCLECC